MSDMRGKCYECKHRGSVPGSAHSSCKHPDIESSPMVELFGILGEVPDFESAAKLGIKADAHGVRSGWFAWPHNFDPGWLIHCNGFEERNGES